MNDDKEDLAAADSFQRAAEVGADVVYNAIRDKMCRRLERGDNPINLIALMLGGIAQLAQEIGELTASECREHAEQQLLAHVRGAFRGAGQSLNEDGTPWCPLD